MLDKLLSVFKSLQDRNVKYVVIGGVAAVLYGVPRTTFDLDIFIEASIENAKQLLDAFLDARIFTASLTTPEEILAHAITVFNDRIRIDVLTSVPGIIFENVWNNHSSMQHSNQNFYIISKDDLIASKCASGRKVDLDDVHILELKTQ